MTTPNDTIAAISTPLGEGGIGIVRLSGTDTLKIAGKIFFPVKDAKISSYASHTVHYGHIKSPGEGEVVDEVLLTSMKAPGTYTAEDMVEINCHGGVMPLKKVLELCLSEGARLAEPGEFTKRAFLNGRIDLSQAEAVLDIIRAKTDASRRIAVEQLRGAFSREISGIRDSLLSALSLIELAIDFTEEDVESPRVDEIGRRVREAREEAKRILETSDKGMVLAEGASVVICGRPNVGKSSLMNALLRHDRVIVTPVAGTTRDVIEESINIAGVRIRLSDTAGIIDTRDRVEIEGIKRSREKLDTADVIVLVLDSSVPVSDRDKEIFDAIAAREKVIVANKSDLPSAIDLEKTSAMFGGEEVFKVSALEKEGLDRLEDAIAEKLFKGSVDIPEGAVVTNIRHKKTLEKAIESVERALETLREEYNGELIASDLNEAVRQLGLITGETVEDGVLDRIFSQFCIGK
jgi:tRNA modification GTPase